MPSAHTASLLTLEIHKEPPDLLLRLSGSLDLLSAGLLQLPRPAALDGVRRLVVDLSGLTFCDVAGLRRLAHLDADYAAAGFDVQLRGAQPQLRRAAMLARLAPGLCRSAEPGLASVSDATGERTRSPQERPRRGCEGPGRWAADRAPEHPAAS